MLQKTEIFYHSLFGDGSRALLNLFFPFATNEKLTGLFGYLGRVLFV